MLVCIVCFCFFAQWISVLVSHAAVLLMCSASSLLDHAIAPQVIQCVHTKLICIGIVSRPLATENAISMEHAVCCLNGADQPVVCFVAYKTLLVAILVLVCMYVWFVLHLFLSLSS